jgi:hypothetical protein
VIGYNSKTLDVNIFIRKIKDPNIQVTKIIGGLSQYKSLTIFHKNFPFDLKFIDHRMFLPSGSLDDNARLFMKDSNLDKGNSLTRRYKKQDEKAERDHKNNVNENDYEEFKLIFETSVCHMCRKRFLEKNKLTLDRLDNDLPHFKNNVNPCCVFL